MDTRKDENFGADDRHGVAGYDGERVYGAGVRPPDGPVVMQPGRAEGPHLTCPR
jgi:hypothetical protein